VVSADGGCVREWTPASLARGPMAIVNGATMPVRQAVGGAQAGARDRSGSTLGRVVLVPALALTGFGAGAIEGIWLMGLGLADVVTGGYFALVPREVTEPSLAPMTPRFLEPPMQPPPTDPCGRPR
jgi:hypothetical protein